MQETVVFALNVSYGIITLAVLGLAVILGLLGVLNMAHGELVAIGAYSAWAIQSAGLPLLLSLPVAAVAAGLIGWVMEITIIRHLYRRPFDTLLATWGISIFLREPIKLGFGLEYKSVIEPVGGSVTLLGAAYPGYRILLMAAVVAGFVGLFLWYRRSHAGTRVRAMVANPTLASAVGIETATLARRAFVLGAASAGLAGCLMAPLIRIGPLHGRGLPAVVVLRARGGRAGQSSGPVHRVGRHRGGGNLGLDGAGRHRGIRHCAGHLDPVSLAEAGRALCAPMT